MIKVKDNYKNQYVDQTCRGCGLENETQSHVLEHCTKLHSTKYNIVKEIDIFQKTKMNLQAYQTKSGKHQEPLRTKQTTTK